MKAPPEQVRNECCSGINHCSCFFLSGKNQKDSCQSEGAAVEHLLSRHYPSIPTVHKRWNVNVSAVLVDVIVIVWKIMDRWMLFD